MAASADLADVGDDLEHEEEGGQEGGAQSSPIYRPREALHNALRDWLALILQVSCCYLCTYLYKFSLILEYVRWGTCIHTFDHSAHAIETHYWLSSLHLLT